LREITKLRQEQLSMSTLPSSAADSTGTTTVSTPTTDGGVLVFVRKRPIFRNELQRGDFDVVATTTTSATAALSSSLDASTAATVVVYRTQMHADMKTKQVQPVAFGCTAAFDEKVSSEEVYRRAAMPLVQETKGGGVATLLMFGQTGSGKTYTMTAIEEHCATGIFDDTTTTTTAKGKITVQVQYLELCGKICRDLVDDARPEVRIMDKEDGSVCFVNAASVVVETAEELFSVIAKAKQRRATQATDRNDESSRSHAVCQMTIYNEGSHAAAQKQQQQRGVLTLVDCAGTERRNDSMYHSRSRQAESVEINASLYALKECIRARSSRTKERHVPYRSNNLTRVLRESLERQDARLAVIATVGPNATDTEHTIETLKTVSSLGGVSLEEGRLQKVSASPSSSKLIAPKRWDHQELVEWLSGKRLVGKAVAGHVDGRLVM
jgi:kinesin family protein 2/24